MFRCSYCCSSVNLFAAFLFLSFSMPFHCFYEKQTPTENSRSAIRINIHCIYTFPRSTNSFVFVLQQSKLIVSLCRESIVYLFRVCLCLSLLLFSFCALSRLMFSFHDDRDRRAHTRSFSGVLRVRIIHPFFVASSSQR